MTPYNVRRPFELNNWLLKIACAFLLVICCTVYVGILNSHTWLTFVQAAFAIVGIAAGSVRIAVRLAPIGITIDRAREQDRSG